MRFSVIVPVYGVEKYIHKCVESILCQTFRDFELILVDDGSKDKCPEICDEYARQDERVRVIHKENGRLVSTRNAGLAVVKGDYVLYVDGDDWVTENWLEAVNAAIINAPQQPDMVVFNALKVFEDRNEPLYRNVEAGFYDKKRLESDIYPYMISDRRMSIGMECIYPSAWNKAYKRELILAHHCENLSITRGEDTSFTLECLLCSESIVVIDDYLYFYNRTNVTSNLARYDNKRVYAYYLLFTYLNEHIVGKYDCVDRQMNDLYANYIATVLTHEIKHHPKVCEASKYFRAQLKEHDIVKFVKARNLPLSAWVFVVLLKLKTYELAMLCTKIWVSNKK